MMMRDRYGLTLTTSSETARDAYVEAVDRLLGSFGRVEKKLIAAIEADPDFALAHAALARQHQLMARGGEARAAADRAVELAGGASARERQHVEIIHALVSGQAGRSLELLRAHLADHPRDAFALSPATGVFGTIGFSGRVDREPELLAFIEPLATHYGEDWWFQSVHAFALVETGQWEHGRDLARSSLEQKPGTPHAAHTLVHALYEGGADREATEFLSGFLADADPDGVLHCHTWWHYAILLLAEGRREEAWTAFSENCLPGQTSSPSINVLTDSASYLWRAELGGAPRDRETWTRVREHYEANFRRPIVFVDAHCGLAYAALGETEAIEACIEQLAELGAAGKLPAEGVAAKLTVGYQAYAEERWDAAIEALEPVMQEVVRIGGSRAQRDLVLNTLLAAYVCAGRVADAHAWLDGVTDRRPTHHIAGLVAPA